MLCLELIRHSDAKVASNPFKIKVILRNFFNSQQDLRYELVLMWWGSGRTAWNYLKLNDPSKVSLTMGALNSLIDVILWIVPHSFQLLRDQFKKKSIIISLLTEARGLLIALKTIKTLSDEIRKELVSTRSVCLERCSSKLSTEVRRRELIYENRQCLNIEL